MIDRHKPPSYLPDDARQWWPVLVDELAARGSLSRVAEHRLAIYCQLFAQYRRVTEFLNQHGQVLEIRNDKGEVKAQTIAPEAVQQAKLVEALRKFDKEFGLLEPAAEDPLNQLKARLVARLGSLPHPSAQ